MSLASVKKDIESACKDCGRTAGDVALIAVTKNHGIDDISLLIGQGHRTFGENRIQEACEKWPALRSNHSDLQLHFIGHLQTNKARDAVKIFDALHTIDSDRLADAVKNEMEKQGRNLPCFIQVNTGEETQKGGITPKELEKLFIYCRDTAKINVIGLMCIPPADEVPDFHFALLHKLSRQLGLTQLSMGMSGDFDRAIRFGATHVRVGSALFQTKDITP